jgi:hypothetical protein
MKVHLLYEAQDFDFVAGLPPGHEALIDDLELAILLGAMAADDKFLAEVSRKVLLTSLHDPQAIRYRQQVLADCLAQPEIIREMYAVAVGALQDKRELWWGGYGGNYQGPSSNLSGAVGHLEGYVARLRQQCGLFVTAQAYRANVARGIFTHFIRQEDPGMVSGRLDDELRRMSAIADQIGPHCLVLFNESFAGTNEREGSEIGHQVVRALLDAQVKVFFVTHRFDFAERFRRQHARSTLFLRAERQPDGGRNYKLAVKDPLPTSFGEDLYYRLGGWLDEDQAARAHG